MAVDTDIRRWHIPHRYTRGPLNDEELWEYVYTMWNIKIPRKKVCANHVPPFKAFSDAFFAREPVIVLKGSRGFGGKTMLVGTLALTEATALGAQVTVLGGSAAQSLRVHEVMDEALFSPRAPDNLILKRNKWETVLTNGSWVRALLASQRSVRGPHPQRLRLDEIDEMEMDILEAAQGQPMSKNGITTQTLMSSTHQYPDGTMTKILERAREKGWAVYEWCYKETSAPPDGWLSEEDIVRKRAEISSAMWKMEYDLHEPSFDGRAIDLAAVEHMFDRKLGQFEGGMGEYIEIEKPNSEKGVYVTGVDWAKEKDYTVIATYRVDQPQWKLVAFERLQRLPWPAMVRRLDDRLDRFGGICAHDATGIGNVVNDLIINKRQIHSIVLGRGNKQSMLSEYIAAIEDGAITSPMIDWTYTEHRHARLDDLFGTGHTPDSIIAGALAWAMRHLALMTTPPPPMTMERERSPWNVDGEMATFSPWKI